MNLERIHIPPGIKPTPYPHEMFVAQILSYYFNTDVTFIKRNETAKTADLFIKGRKWEIKSPIGNSKRTIQNNLRAADDQSQNVIINLVRCKMTSDEAVRRIKHELGRANRIKKLLVIKKDGKVLVLK